MLRRQRIGAGELNVERGGTVAARSTRA